jgi:hypothetical protein
MVETGGAKPLARQWNRVLATGLEDQSIKLDQDAPGGSRNLERQSLVMRDAGKGFGYPLALLPW